MNDGEYRHVDVLLALVMRILLIALIFVCLHAKEHAEAHQNVQWENDTLMP